MIDIGINYINQDLDEIYEVLIQRGYINTLKFPGKYCDYKEFEKFINIFKKLNTKIDIHGLPEMIPSIHSKNFIQNVQWDKIEKIITKQDSESITRISTHIGVENNEKLEQNAEGNITENIKKIKEKFFDILNSEIQCGTENLPGGFNFDPKTLTPEFISNSWKNSDFGVFDISHAKIAAKDLNMKYEDYIEKLANKDKVKILHVSGNINETNKYNNKPDKHVLIKSEEIKDIVQAIETFKNIDLIISEYAYNTKYNYKKEIAIEAITLFTIVKTMNEEKAKITLKTLEDNLKEDCSNLSEVVKI